MRMVAPFVKKGWNAGTRRSMAIKRFLAALGGGEGRGEVGDSRAFADAHLTLPSLRAGPLPLPPEGRRGILSARGIAMTGIVLAAVIGYLLGSIRFGVVRTRLAGPCDRRRSCARWQRAHT